MFLTRIHSVDAKKPLTFKNLEFSTTTSMKNSTAIVTTPSTTQNSNLNSNSDSDSVSRFFERKGVVHLFRTVTRTALQNPIARSTCLFLVAVPNYFSYEDFLRFCEVRIDHISELIFIRNDAVEDRYSIVIRLINKVASDGFYCVFNGKKFKPGEAEVCHLLFVHAVDFQESAEVAGTPPDACVELPTCPVCLERLDPDTSGILTAVCDHSFQCPCTSKWTHLSCQVCRFCQQQDDRPTCGICGTIENLWVCLICGFVGCGRYKEGHAVRHWKQTQHCFSLDLTTQQIWDYVNDTYVHRLNQSRGDTKYGEMNAHCMSFEGDCASCTCSEDSFYGGAIYNSKVDAIVNDYNHLLASQLETQRQFYESRLAEVRSKLENAIADAVEEAVNSKMQDIQTKLQTCIEEKNTVAVINRSLIREQEIFRKKFKEIEEREAAELKLRDMRILDLEEQIRDVSVYIEAQKRLGDMMDSDGIKGGTLLPVPSKQSSPANTRKQTKSGRRRN